MDLRSGDQPERWAVTPFLHLYRVISRPIGTTCLEVNHSSARHYILPGALGALHLVYVQLPLLSLILPLTDQLVTSRHVRLPSDFSNYNKDLPESKIPPPLNQPLAVIRRVKGARATTMCQLEGDYFSRCGCLIGKTKLCEKARGVKPPPPLDKNGEPIPPAPLGKGEKPEPPVSPPPLNANYEPGRSVCTDVGTAKLFYHFNCHKYPAQLCGNGTHVTPSIVSPATPPTSSGSLKKIIKGRLTRKSQEPVPTPAEYQHQKRDTLTSAQKEALDEVVGQVVEKLIQQIEKDYKDSPEWRVQYRPTYLTDYSPTGVLVYGRKDIDAFKVCLCSLDDGNSFDYDGED